MYYLTNLDLFDIYTKGIPKGALTVITGKEGTGKTTFLLQTLNALFNQDKNLKCLFYNTEKNLDENRIHQFITNPAHLQNLIFIEDKFTFEDIWSDIEEKIIKTEFKNNKTNLIICWDSIAATTFREEEKGKIGDAEMAMRARLLSSIFRKYLGIFRKLNITIIATNQLRFKIGATPFEDPYIMPGGMAPYYAASLYFYLKKKGFYKFATNHNAVITTVQVKKNSNAWSPVEFPLILTPSGYDNDLSVFQYCMDNDYIVHSGGAGFIFKKDDFELKFKRTDWPEVYKNNKNKILTIIKQDYEKNYSGTSKTILG